MVVGQETNNGDVLLPTFCYKYECIASGCWSGDQQRQGDRIFPIPTNREECILYSVYMHYIDCRAKLSSTLHNNPSKTRQDL